MSLCGRKCGNDVEAPILCSIKCVHNDNCREVGWKINLLICHSQDFSGLLNWSAIFTTNNISPTYVPAAPYSFFTFTSKAESRNSANSWNRECLLISFLGFFFKTTPFFFERSRSRALRQWPSCLAKGTVTERTCYMSHNTFLLLLEYVERDNLSDVHRRPPPQFQIPTQSPFFFVSRIF